MTDQGKEQPLVDEHKRRLETMGSQLELTVEILQKLVDQMRIFLERK